MGVTKLRANPLHRSCPDAILDSRRELSSVTKVFALVLVSLTVGLVHSYTAPKLEQLVPATWRQNMWTQAAFSGAFILVAVFVSAAALRALKIPAGRVA